MSLNEITTRFDNLIQGQQEWHNLRNKFIKTASRTPIVLGLSPFSNLDKLAQEIKFGIKPFYSKAMQDGNELEDMVREKANAYFNDVFMPTVGVKNDLLASLDGINFAEDTIIEIKVSEKTFQDIKSGTIPKHYLWQIKHQMQVFDSVEKGYLVAYSKELDEIIVSDPILKDDSFGNDFFIIIEAWNKFFEYLETYELPKQNVEEDVEALSFASELFEVNQQIKELQEKEKELKAKLEQYATSDKTTIGNLTISKTSRKTVEYTKLLNELKVDDAMIDKYTKVSSGGLTFRFSK